MALVGGRSAVDIDFASVGKREADVHLIEAAGAVVFARSRDVDMASRDAAESLFELRNMRRDRVAVVFVWFRSFERNLSWCFHDTCSQCLHALARNAELREPLFEVITKHGFCEQIGGGVFIVQAGGFRA